MGMVKRFIVVCVAVISLLMLVTPIAAQQTISYESYLVLIGQLREQTMAARALDQAGCSAALQGVAERLGEITAVQMPNGEVMFVQHQPIVEALTSQPCRPSQASNLLAGVCPDTLCPATAVPLNPDTIELIISPPSSQQLPPSQPLPEVVEELEQLLNEENLLPKDGAQGEEVPSEGSDAPSVPIDSETIPEGAPADTPGDEIAEEGDDGGEGAPEDGDSGDGGAGDGGTGDDGGGAEGEPVAEGEPGEESGNEGNDGGAVDGEGASESGPEGEPVGESGDGGTESDETGSESAETGSGDGGTGESGDVIINEVEGEGGTQPDGSVSRDGVEGEGETAVSPTRIPPTLDEQLGFDSRLLWLVIVIALLFMIASLAYFVFSGSQREAQVLTQKEPETAVEAVDIGRKLMLAGEYREAVRHVFLAALLAMDEQGVLQFDTTRTNYELLRELRRNPQTVEYLTPVVETFERVWYGFERVELAEYDQLVQQVDLLKGETV